MTSSPRRWWFRKVVEPVEPCAKPCRTAVGTINDRHAPQSVLVANLPADLRNAFEERTAIAEFDGGLDRDAAERLAWAEVIGKLEGAGP